MRHKRTLTHSFAAAILLAASVSMLIPARAADDMQSMPGMTTMPLQKPMPGMSIYNLSSHWQRQDGHDTGLATLRGAPVVAAMVYSHCPDICPLTTERMRELEQGLPDRVRDQVRFALFSLDWVRDTPDQLSHYAAQHHLDLRRWILFHGDEGAVRELAAALGISFRRDANGNFQHSIAIFLLDSDGVVTGTQTDLQASSAPLLEKLRRAAGNSRRH